MIMNRSKYFDYIEVKINFLSYRIKNRGKINLLDLNIHSETFFAEMLNKVLDLKLKAPLLQMGGNHSLIYYV